MIYKGFKFGMLLQIAIGPVCLFIFQTAASNGLGSALLGVSGVTLIDALFIIAVILGIGTVFERHKAWVGPIKGFGSLVLFLFGMSLILGAFHIKIIPGFHWTSMTNQQNTFIMALLLTLSNPLTILFWAGVFSTQLASFHMSLKELYAYGFGAVLSTTVFLGGVSILGYFAHFVINPDILNGLNAVVGILLVYFGYKTWQKDTSKLV